MMAASGAADEKCLLNKRPAALAPAAESQAEAAAAMRDYLRLVSAAPKADVSVAFTHKAGLRFWLRHGPDTFVTHVEDPFAHQVAEGGATLSAPLAFVRSGNGATALGLWRVEAASGEPLVPYRTNFRRESKAWRIPIAYHCLAPGDSEAYAKALAEREAKRERKRAAQAASRQGRGGGWGGSAAKASASSSHIPRSPWRRRREARLGPPPPARRFRRES